MIKRVAFDILSMVAGWYVDVLAWLTGKEKGTEPNQERTSTGYSVNVDEWKAKLEEHKAKLLEARTRF